jgi:2'-5' RNA ligase
MLEPFTAGVVTLYRSDPSRSGARYTALERLELRAR